MTGAEGTGAKPRRKGRRIIRILAGTFALLVALVLAAGGYVAFHLTQGPMEIAAAARIAEGVVSDAVGGGRRTTIERAELTGTLTDGLAIRLTNVAVGETADGLTVRIPAASIGLQALPLLMGDLRPTSLELERPTVVLDLPRMDRIRLERARAAEAAASSTASPAAPAVAPEAPAAEAVSAIEGPLVLARLEALGKAVAHNLRLIRAQGLRTLTIKGGEITVMRADGPAGSRRVVIPDVDVTSLFETPTGDVDLGFSAQGEIGRWSMRLRHVTAPGGDRHSLVFNADDVTFRDLLGEHDPDLEVAMPIYPQVSVDYDAADRLVGAKLDLRIGAGNFRFGKEPEDELIVDDGRLVVTWDAGAQRFLVERAAVQVGPSFVELKGSLTPPKPGAGDRWQIHMEHEKGVVAPRDVPGKGLDLTGLLLDAGYDSKRRALLIDDLQVHFTGGALRALGHIDFAQPKPVVTVNIVFTPVGAAAIAHAWPQFIAAGARKWFIENVQAGKVRDVLVKLQFPLLVEPRLWPADAVVMNGRFERATARAFGELPLVTEAEGRFAMENKRFEVVVDRGAVATRGPRKPQLTSFRFEVPDAMVKPARAILDIRATGDNVGLGEIIDAEPLHLLASAGIKLDGLTGSGDIKGRVEMTFDHPFDYGKLDYRFEAGLEKFGSPSPILGRRFQDANLKVQVDRKGTTVTGKAKIDGVQADVNMFEPSEKSNAPERRDFAMTLDDAARTRMGLDLAGMVAGPIKVEIGQPNANDQQKRIVADLTGSRLVIPQFGWTKGPGVPAKAMLDLVEEDKGGARIDNFSIESEGLQVRGAMTVDKDKRLASADLGRFALRKGDDARVKLQRGADQVLNATFEAGSFDIRSLLQSLKRQGDGPEVDPKKQSDMSIKVRAARLVGYNDIALTDVVIDAQVRSQVVTRLQLTGRAPGGRSVEISIRPEGNRRVLTVASDDAGAVLGFLDIYERLRGGSLNLSGTLSGPGVADGDLRIVGFGLLPPKKERAAALRTTNDGLREVAVRDVPISEETTFDRFAVRFAMRNGVITVTDGIAKGQATGATMSGQIDLNNQRLTVAGTFIPLYGLNNLVSRIPIFGEIVGAGRNEGLVGVTFKVVGSVDNPVLQFNPISAIAPGIFRKIFEYRVEDSSPPARGGSAN